MSTPFRLTLAGLGTVGAAVARALREKGPNLARAAGRPLELVGVSARDPHRDRGVDLDRIPFHADAVAMARDVAADAFVELVGGADGTARLAVEAALQARRHVVTGNKALLASAGTDLARLAEENGVTIAFEAAVAGGIPVIKALREALAGNAVLRVSGILNGTCNYILSRMEAERLTFAECLAAAQALGYAEADPTFDVEGFDTAHKLSLLTAIAFGSEVDAGSIYVEGISNVTPLDLEMAAELGFRIKLLGVAERVGGAIEQRVHPTMAPLSSPLAQVMGVTNAVSIVGDMAGELTLVGPGAGGSATASAVLADIVDLARGNAVSTFARPAASLLKPVRAAMQRHEGGYYVRLEALDRPGAAAAIAGRMAESGISLESILQKGRAYRTAADSVPVILITYATTEGAVRGALEAIAADGVLAGAPQVIRIER